MLPVLLHGCQAALQHSGIQRASVYNIAYSIIEYVPRAIYSIQNTVYSIQPDASNKLAKQPNWPTHNLAPV